MSKGTDREIVNSWIRELNNISALISDLTNVLYWPYIIDVSQDQTVAVGETCTFLLQQKMLLLINGSTLHKMDGLTYQEKQAHHTHSL